MARVIRITPRAYEKQFLLFVIYLFVSRCIENIFNIRFRNSACVFQVKSKNIPLIGMTLKPNTYMFMKDTDFNFDVDKCILCNFPSRSYEANSCERDIIIGPAFIQCKNIFPCSKSLRTAQSKALLVAMMDLKTYKTFTPKNIKLLEECGCFLVNLGDYHFRNVKVLQFTRYSCYYDFLILRRGLFNRVLSIDIFDVVFQGDPFTKMMDPNCLYVCEEPIQIKNDKTNYNWIKNLIPKRRYDYYKDFNVINGGIISGGYYPYIAFLEVFFSFFTFSDPKSFLSDDQGYINMIVREGLIEKKGFKVHKLTYIDHYANLYMMHDWKLNWTFGFLRSPNATDKYYLLLHQIYKNNKFCKTISIACPPGDISISKYDGCSKDK